MAQRRWLLKSEPNVYSIDDLRRDETTFWEGVRNYQARNILRDDIRVGDQILFYHSNAKPPGVAGVAQVIEAAMPDPDQFDSRSRYYDAKASADEPRWYGITIRYEKKFETLVSLDTIKMTPSLSEMVLIKRSRLSVQPVSDAEYRQIVKLGSA